MLNKIITLACALFGVFSALSLETWLRSRIVKNSTTNGNYSILRSRTREFWSIQYLPLILILAAVGGFIAFVVKPINAAVFLAGAVLCFVSVAIGSRTVVTGSIASSSIAGTDDIRNSLKTAYRSAAVMGLSVSSIALIGLGVLFFFLDNKQLINMIACFGLGASITSFCLGISGTAFSGAYSLSVRKNDFTDYTGMFIGSGADYVETYILSACAAALLAGVGVDTSGISSTFNATTAARFPLVVLASGIVASAIGIFAYRGHIVKNPAAGLTAGNFLAAALIIGVTAYFSLDVMQSYIYAFCVAAGIVASLISGEIMKIYSSDGIVFNKYVPKAKTVGAIQSVIYSLGIGMVSVFIPAALATVAMIVAYMFASYYGIALAAVGINSMAAVNSAARGFSINTASASEIASINDPDAESPNPADVLLTASSRTDVIGKTYSAVSTYVTLVALFTALSVVANNQSTLLLSTNVFTGMAIGAVFVFVCAGLIIRSIRITGQVLRERLDDAYDSEKRISSLRGLVPLYVFALFVPAAAGALGGVNGLIAFACSATITGMSLLFTFNNSGKYFDRFAAETLGTVIKLMVAVTLVCAPVFMEFGGVF